MKQILIHLYKYNHWRYSKIFEALDAKQDLQDFITKDQGLFFHDVLGTLKHNLSADYIWYGRMMNIQNHDDVDLKALIKLWRSDDPKVFSELPLSYEEVKVKLDKVNQLFLELIQNNDDEWLAGEFQYQDSNEKDLNKSRHEVLFHLINHHTHHLGQVSTAFTQQYGRIGYPSVDLIYYKQ